jgi:hypothetical protein
MECWVKALMISIPLFHYSITPLFLEFSFLFFVYFCPDSYVGENFKQDRMFHSAVDNMRMGYPFIQGIQTTIHLWNHS